MSADHWGRMARLLAERTAGKVRPEGRQTFNPKPLGSMLPGGVTAHVLELLSARPGTRYTLDRIARCIDRSPKSVSWALCVLRSRDLIASEPEPTGRYHRWFVPRPSEFQAAISPIQALQADVTHHQLAK